MVLTPSFFPVSGAIITSLAMFTPVLLRTLKGNSLGINLTPCISIPPSDPLFDEILDSLESEILEHGSLDASTASGPNDEAIKYSLAPSKPVRFWFRRWPIFLNLQHDMLEQGYCSGRERSLALWTYGFSTHHLKAFLLEAKVKHDKKGIERYCPTSKESDFRVGNWKFVGNCKARPIATIALDRDQKEKLLQDIREFILPTTEDWYLKTGIPYRRGYLFHGPPGSGKSSLAIALAGHFRLKLYVLQAGSADLTDTQLDSLLSKLPCRSILLIEDIDAAALSQDRRSIASVEESRGASLSGLLNGIDGSTSSVGYVLIISTNYKSRLDPALIRPGRIDEVIELTNATKAQAFDIFMNFYSDNPGDLPKLAGEFSAYIPDEKVSPAEIQGYLLHRKRDPVKAVDDVKKWAEGNLSEDRNLRLGPT